VNVGYKNLTLILQGLQQFQRLTIQAIHADPVKANADLPGMVDNLQRQLELGSMNPLRSRNIRFLTPGGIVRPLARQIQSRINQTDSIASAQCPEDSDLTIVLLPQPAIPLARHTHRFVALLLKRALVKVQPCRPCIPHARISLPGYSIHDRSIIPGGMRQKILQYLIVTVGNCFGHTLHVAFVRLHQPVQVLLSRAQDAMVSRLKIITKRLRESLVVRNQALGKFPMPNPTP
jgi:hypothetical protein